MRYDEEHLTARIPADVEQPDKILVGLTGRQLVIVMATAVVVLLIYSAARAFVTPPVIALIVVPLGAVGIALALGRRDGMSLDRFTLAALAFLRSPKRLVPAADSVPTPPTWCQIRGTLPAPLRLPVIAVRPDGALQHADGGGVSVLVEASTVSFALRTPAEQTALVAGFGRWLNGLDGCVQILIRAQAVDLTGMVDQVRSQAPGLPHPALEEAALDHAVFLTELAEQRELLSRQVLLVISGATAQTTARRARGVARDAAAQVAMRRAEEATRALASFGAIANVLDGEQAIAVLTECLNPGALIAPSSTSIITSRTSQEAAS